MELQLQSGIPPTEHAADSFTHGPGARFRQAFPSGRRDDWPRLRVGVLSLRVEERFRRFLGFRFNGQYYEFLALTFGLRWSAFYFHSTGAGGGDLEGSRPPQW